MAEVTGYSGQHVTIDAPVSDVWSRPSCDDLRWVEQDGRRTAQQIITVGLL